MAIILILIAFPSFKLLYLMDGNNDYASMTIIAEGKFGPKPFILNKIVNTYKGKRKNNNKQLIVFIFSEIGSCSNNTTSTPLFIQTFPSSAVSWLANILSKVVLPDPFLATNAILSPSSI